MGLKLGEFRVIWLAMRSTLGVQQKALLSPSTVLCRKSYLKHSNTTRNTDPQHRNTKHIPKLREKDFRQFVHLLG